MNTSPLFDVFGLGYCSDDYLGIVPHIPPFDFDTVDMPSHAHDGGGPVATALVTLARLGARVSYMGVLGDDDSGVFMQHELEREGVDLRHTRIQSGGRSPVCMILVEEATGRRAIMCYRGTLGEYALTDAARADLRTAPFLHIDGHWIEAVEEAAALVHDAGGTVVFDANRPRPDLERFLACTDILICTGTFPAAATGHHELPEASRQLMGMGPHLVVTTLGPRGCYVYGDREEFHVPGYPVPVVDTTGAGDAFHGAFIYGLLQDGWSLHRVARFANAVAAWNCRTLGGRRGLPRLEEIQAFITQSADPS